MAGTYTKKEFGVGPEEQTLLKDSNGTRIIPSKGNGIARLPSWLQENATAFLEWLSCVLFSYYTAAQTSL